MFKCVHRQQWNCHNKPYLQKIIIKKVFCLSACIVLNVILWKLSVLFVVVLHIEQFDYTFARFVWITCQYDIFLFDFVVEQIPSGRNPRSMWVEGRGGREGGRNTFSGDKKKRVTALHCNLFSRIKYYALHKVYCTHRRTSSDHQHYF